MDAFQFGQSLLGRGRSIFDAAIGVEQFAARRPSLAHSPLKGC